MFELIVAEDRGQLGDRAELDRLLRTAVAEIVRQQAEVGIDLVSDGELGKIGYATYVRHRLSGFEIGDVPRATPADLDAYPTWRDRQVALGTAPKYLRPICRGPIAYVNREPLERDLENLAAAVAEVDVEGAFVNAASPGIIALFQPNEHYPSRDEYLAAIAEAMKTEYEAIVEAGFLLQIDSPDLAMGRHIMYRDSSDEQFVESVAVHVAAINQGLRDIPPDRVRIHVCWGNYEGPHHLDIELRKTLAELVKAKPSTFLFEASNPRHAHEWPLWTSDAVPADKVLVPGVIDTTTNFIEHPDLVAERICRYAERVGAERVMAGTDCGMSTWAGVGAVDTAICWAKLRSLADGAARASELLAASASNAARAGV